MATAEFSDEELCSIQSALYGETLRLQQIGKKNDPFGGDLFSRLQKFSETEQLRKRVVSLLGRPVQAKDQTPGLSASRLEMQIERLDAYTVVVRCSTAASGSSLPPTDKPLQTSAE